MPSVCIEGRGEGAVVRVWTLCAVALLWACGGVGGSGGSDAIPVEGDAGFANGEDGGTGPLGNWKECTSDEDCAAPAPWCSLSKRCLECLEDAHCGADEQCHNVGQCLPTSCQPGEVRCTQDGEAKLTCNAAGNDWDTFGCIDGLCMAGACTGCLPNKKVCQGLTIMQCDAAGGDYVEIGTCAQDEICVQGDCMACYPGTQQCNVFIGQVCSIDGYWQDVVDCGAEGKNCFAGSCVSPCLKDPKFLSHSGCDYWAVDLDNHHEAQDSPYAIIVSNLSEKAANVTITRKFDADSNSAEIDQRVIQPGGLAIFDLPPSEPNGSGIVWKAYRVQSDTPIIAYQFNPLENVDVFSNDASLLLPATTLGTEYIVMSRAEFLAGGPEVGLFETCAAICSQFEGGQCVPSVDPATGFPTEFCALPYRGSFSVVAAAQDTEVTMVPTANTLAGDGFPPMVAGQSYTFTIQPYQVLNVLSNQDGGDLTGTVITATKAIAVFGGHESSLTGEYCCTDHLEQQLFPTKSWGKTYVAAKSITRGIENDYWRILAMTEDTKVTFQPQISGPVNLDRGEWFEIATTYDFTITADKPITVAQILASSQEILDGEMFGQCTSNAQCPAQYACTTGFCYPPSCAGEGAPCIQGHACTFNPYAFEYYCQPTGDPALILTPPIEQWREDYVFLTPNKYQDDYVNIIAPVGATVTFDGLTLPAGGFETVSGTQYMVNRLKVGDGVHSLVANEPVGVIAYGYDRDVSYGYTAGLNLNDL